MKIWINSCHAALEYDHAKMFTELGHDVSGLFDIGSDQRPKVAGMTDVDAPSEIHEAGQRNKIMLSDVGNPDVVVVHQTADFPERAAWYAKQGAQVVSIVFGQGNPSDHMRLAEYARRYGNIHVVPYAVKEFELYNAMRVPADRLHFIRFGKPVSDFDPDRWEGTDPHCFTPCNSIHKRGDGCNWGAVHLMLGAGIPIQLSGRDTEEVGGLGELTFDEYRAKLRTSMCYLHVGTIPAPYTLTLIEAACSGTPIVCLDNGHGLSREGFRLNMTDKVDVAIREIRKILTNAEHRNNMHEESCQLARSTFSGEVVTNQWDDLLNNIEMRIGR